MKLSAFLTVNKSFTGYLWKYDEVTGTLENKLGDWKYLEKKWTIPDGDEIGTIEEVGTSKVVGLSTKRFQNEVILGPFDDSEGQKWTKSKATTNGYFTLKNPLSGKFISLLFIKLKNFLLRLSDL